MTTARNLKIRAEVVNGEVYLNRDDLIEEINRVVPFTLSVMAVRFVAAFTHALSVGLPNIEKR